jgi:phage baseplate assembly protein W
MAAVSDSRTSIRTTMPQRYRDLPLSFIKHPGTGDVRPLNDINAVKQSVKNLILTNYGERPFAPRIGGNVTKYLFEPANPFTAQSIQREIEETIKKQEKRVSGVIVQVADNSEANGYVIQLQYTVVSLNVEVETSFFLQRLR